jgi:hypothetical protein
MKIPIKVYEEVQETTPTPSEATTIVNEGGKLYIVSTI